MLTCVILILLCQTALGFYLVRDPFAPYVIMPGVWLVILLLFHVVPNNYYPIANNFIPAITLWSSVFFLVSVATSYKTSAASAASIDSHPNEQIMRFYWLLSFAVSPVIVGVTIWTALTKDPENMFRYMRMMSTGMDKNIDPPNFGPALYVVSVAYVSMFFALIYGKSKKLVAGIVVVNLLLAFITMAKTTFLCVFFAMLYVLYMKKVVSIKAIAFGLVGFLFFSLALNAFRASASLDEDSAGDDNFFAMYLLSSSVAFDRYVEPCSSHQAGENTFRLAYALQKAAGADVEVISPILPWVGVPEPTNTYTNMYPFYKDYGLWGIVVFAAAYGAFFGFLYKKTVTGGKLALIVYALFLTFLMLEFLGEFIFTNLSQSIQYIVLAILPFAVKARLALWKT